MKELENVMSQLEKITDHKMCNLVIILRKIGYNTNRRFIVHYLERQEDCIVIYDLSTQYGVAQGLCCYASQIWRSRIKFI